MPKIHYHPSVTSTMDVARELAANAADHLDCIIADEQIAGRGRLGRVWQTFPHHSLAVTFILKTGLKPQLPLVAALSLAEAMSDATNGRMPQIKWPNDLLVNGKKIAGLLVESGPTTPTGEKTMLLGIGLNLTTPANLPDDFPGTTLQAELGFAPSRQDLLQKLTDHLQQNLHLLEIDDWEVFANHYQQSCCTLGQNVTWQKPSGEKIQGTATGLTASGNLLLNTGAKEVEIHSGDIIQ